MAGGARAIRLHRNQPCESHLPLADVLTPKSRPPELSVQRAPDKPDQRKAPNALVCAVPAHGGGGGAQGSMGGVGGFRRLGRLQTLPGDMVNPGVVCSGCVPSVQPTRYTPTLQPTFFEGGGSWALVPGVREGQGFVCGFCLLPSTQPLVKVFSGRDAKENPFGKS